jgi:hypothetical protein
MARLIRQHAVVRDLPIFAAVLCCSINHIHRQVSFALVDVYGDVDLENKALC